MLNHNSKCSNFCFMHLNIFRAKIHTTFIHTSSCLLPSFTDTTQKSAETVTKVTVWINYLPINSQTFFSENWLNKEKHLQFIVVFCFVIYWHATSSHHNNELARNGPWEELVDCQIKEIVVGISNSLRHTHIYELSIFILLSLTVIEYSYPYLLPSLHQCPQMPPLLDELKLADCQVLVALYNSLCLYYKQNSNRHPSE